MTTCFISGVTGQDGILLARRLQREGARVVGTCRPGSAAAKAMAVYLHGIEVVPVDIRDREGLARVLADVRPDEFYNLAALSSVRRSWESPAEAHAVNGQAVVDLVALLERYPETRLVQAASAEERGGAATSPYAQAKGLASAAVHAAQAEGRFAATATLHIHESPLRRPDFVARKITRAVAEIAAGLRSDLVLGRLEVRRDWGAAEDHVDALIRIMRADIASNYEVATGRTTSLEELVSLAFGAADLGDGSEYVRTDAALARPVDSDEIVGDGRRLRSDLGWEPSRSIDDVIKQMVEVDMRRIRTGVEEDARYLEECASEFV